MKRTARDLAIRPYKAGQEYPDIMNKQRVIAQGCIFFGLISLVGALSFPANGADNSQATPPLTEQTIAKTVATASPNQVIHPMQLAFDPPPGKGSPGQSAGGGTRALCQGIQAEGLPLTLVLPPTGKGLTTRAYPTFLVFVPETTAQVAEFTLRNADETYAYRTHVLLSGRSGIIPVSLPTDQPPLEEGQEYKWSIALICDSSDRFKDMVAEGYVQREYWSSEVQDSLAQQSLLDRSAFYGRQGIWYDMMATLFEAQQTQIEGAQVTSEWVGLLRSPTVDLAQLTDQPLLISSPHARVEP